MRKATRVPPWSDDNQRQWGIELRAAVSCAEPPFVTTEAIREAFTVSQEADVMHGNGHARRALAQYVTGLVRDANPDTVAARVRSG